MTYSKKAPSALGVAFWLICICPHAAHSASKCQVKKTADLPVTLEDRRAEIKASFNGQEAILAIDSGAFWSLISSASAERFKLRTDPLPDGISVRGVGGEAEVGLATVKDFEILGAHLKNRQFLVGGTEIQGQSQSIGVLGQNILQFFDVEYDLSEATIRLFRTEDCKKTNLTYWLKNGEQFSMIDLLYAEGLNAATLGYIYINDQKIKFELDTGAPTSVLTLQGAARAGIKPDSPGVVAAGTTGGIGRHLSRQWIAPVQDLKIGDNEEIKNSRVRIADIDLDGIDMLLGLDFLMAHRVFVATAERRMFFTFNGGAVFKLDDARLAAAPVAAEASSSAAPTPGEATAPPDAAALARLGSAQVTRRDFAQGIANLTKAVAAAPDDPEFHYQRANAYLANGQVAEALADFDQTLKLKENFLPAYLPRAEIELQEHREPDAIADLDKVDRLSPPSADLRLQLAEMEAGIDLFAAAMAQFDLWMKHHPEDSRRVRALDGRCFASAMQNQDLDAGMRNCNSAVSLGNKKVSGYGELLTDRGLMRLRQKDPEKAIADFDAALKLEPENARALYLKGVAESHLHKPKADADIEAAKKLEPKMTTRYAQFGFVP